MEHLLQLIADNPSQFSEDFAAWIPENMHVWDAFVEQAMKIRARGHQHYSSYTIVEFLRHHSAIEEVGSAWKINNNHRPYLPRLFDLCYPHMAGMF